MANKILPMPVVCYWYDAISLDALQVAIELMILMGTALIIAHAR